MTSGAPASISVASMEDPPSSSWSVADPDGSSCPVVRPAGDRKPIRTDGPGKGTPGMCWTGASSTAPSRTATCWMIICWVLVFSTRTVVSGSTAGTQPAATAYGATTAEQLPQLLPQSTRGFGDADLGEGVVDINALLVLSDAG